MFFKYKLVHIFKRTGKGGDFILDLNLSSNEKNTEDKVEQDKRENLHNFECEGIKVYIKHKETGRTLVDGLNQFFSQL